MKLYKGMCVLIFLFISSVTQAVSQKADFIIFSFDRPLQLYALLESTECLMTGLEDIYVVYRSSSETFEQGYSIVQQDFPYVHFLKQLVGHENNFKALTVQAFTEGRSDYILFGVDDIVVKDEVDIAHAIHAMNEYRVYGCYLRLAPHINYLYSWQRSQQVPSLKEVQGGFIWQFQHASPISDWGYPHTVDMTIYKKSDIAEDIKNMHYYNPNSLEAQWSQRADKIRKRSGFCYPTSKIVNLPLNLVQTMFKGNPHMTCEELSPQELLKTFLEGNKMDIWPLFQINNKSAHMEYEPIFIERQNPE